MKKICLLGATGSIGKSTFELVKKNPEKFQIVGASGHSNFKDLEKLASEFKIPYLLDTKQDFDYSEFLKKCEADIVLNSIVSFAGLRFSLETLNAKVPLALANKESLVAGGDLLMALSKKNKTPIYPVDSEHSAIFECLIKVSEDIEKQKAPMPKYKNFEKILLTCSGGPFFGKTFEDLKNVSLSQALKHPNWSMGAKITIDSATLANKCLEFFEAMHLFHATKNQIEIVIHRESVVHSMVEFSDSSILAQIAPPNMELPISMALNFPKKNDCHLPRQSFKNLNLSFFEPDKKAFKTLEILDYCAERMQNFPIVFNAVNEVAVAKFLNEEISFSEIFEILERVIDQTKLEDPDCLEKILEIDRRARALVLDLI